MNAKIQPWSHFLQWIQINRIWMEVFCFICITGVIEKRVYFVLHVIFMSSCYCLSNCEPCILYGVLICSFNTASMYPSIYFKQQWHHQIESHPRGASSRLVMVADCKAQMSFNRQVLLSKKWLPEKHAVPFFIKATFGWFFRVVKLDEQINFATCFPGKSGV